jgi:hypothetical protein
MNTAVETFTHNGTAVEILHDFDGSTSNPRDNDNMGTFFTAHRRYSSPDKVTRADVDAAVAPSKRAVVLPVWGCEHGAIAYAAAETNPFHRPWDSGQAGVIYCDLETIRKEYGVKRVTKALRAKVEACLKAEVEEYSKWANGEVYGFRLLDDEGEETDSCWGFIGLDYVKEAAKEAAA